MILRLAWRSLWRNRRRTLITLVSIGLGLAFAIFFVALAEGVYTQLIRDATRMLAGHLTLEHRDYHAAPAVDLYLRAPRALREELEAIPGVERTKALILGAGMARTASGAVGIALMGVEPAVERELSPLARKMEKGRYLEEGDGALVVLGAGLAKQLGLEPGKKLVIASNDAGGQLVESLCRVAGTFRTGVDEVDESLVQAPLGFARELYGLPPEGLTQLGVVLRDADEREPVRAALRAIAAREGGGLGMVEVRGWEELMPGLAGYVRIDRASNLIMQGLLIALILFTVLNTLLMSALERAREFAVLLALGTPLSRLRLQVLAETALLGVLGCALGTAAGGSLSWWLHLRGWDIGFLYSEGVSVSGFALDTLLYPELTPGVLAALAGGVFSATVLTGLLPLRHIGRLPIVSLLRVS